MLFWINDENCFVRCFLHSTLETRRWRVHRQKDVKLKKIQTAQFSEYMIHTRFAFQTRSILESLLSSYRQYSIGFFFFFSLSQRNKSNKYSNFNNKYIECARLIYERRTKFGCLLIKMNERQNKENMK